MKAKSRRGGRLAIAWLVCAIGSPAAASGQFVAGEPAPDPYARAVEQGRVLIDSLMRARNIPGLSIAVSVGRRVVWSEGFGFANLEHRIPVRPSTKFRIGSISKSLTAAALALLYEGGQLDFDEPVQRYVPTFPVKQKGVITPRHLAGHLAGIRHYRGNEMLSSRRYATVLEGLTIFAGDTLLTPPGTTYRYSSYGWNLLSAVVEGASGADFLAYMRARVFGPLGMRQTVADYTDSIIAGRTGFYARTRDGTVINAPYVDNSYKWAGGGFLSTPEDLLLFANAHMEEGFLHPETLRLLTTSQQLDDGSLTGYGIGWFVGERNGEPAFWHSGGSVGGNALLLVFPESGVALAVTANVARAGYGDLPARIAGMFNSRRALETRAR